LVVAGATETLTRDHPVLFLDVHDIGDTRLSALSNALQALGYQARELESGEAAAMLEAGKDYVLRAG
ncbi:MAG TPA: hypothetical protein VKN63_08595, partial [Afifellaceae bacterium]|nr:hypothetical protein [Afifellaceae bacterium]